MPARERMDPFRRSLLVFAHDDACGLLRGGAPSHAICTFLLESPALGQLFSGLGDADALALAKEVVREADIYVSYEREDGEIQLQALIDEDDERRRDSVLRS